MSYLCTENIAIKIGADILYKDVNITINPGEMWAILGANGSGKTTLLHTLAGLLPVAHGQILLADQHLKQLPAKHIARTLGLLFQDTHATFPQTVWEYCETGRYPHLSYLQKTTQKDQRIVHAALQQMELDHLCKRRITQLSGGEKRRLAIAALLAQTPCIYLLDEPTNHLDLRHQLNVLQHFRALTRTQSAAVVLTLHDINLAQQYCNRFLFLFPDGTILQGTDDIMLTPANLTRLYQHPIAKLPHADIPFWYPL